MHVDPSSEHTATAEPPAKSSLFQLVYVSSAVTAFSAGELMTLLEKSRQRNSRAKISGLLLYHDGNFMQLLEGEEQRVRATYARIVQDPRHRGCLPLIQAAVTERAFPDWSMGFRNLVSPEAIATPGYSEFLRTNEGEKTLPTTSSRALKLFGLFREKLR